MAEQRSDRAIASLARGQHHVVTLGQLTALGLSARAVRHRVAAGRLIQLHRGVYAVGRPTIEGRWMGAVLASGDDAALSHRSAAALWDIAPQVGRRIDVAVSGSTGRIRTRIAVHSGAALADADRAVRAGIPCTSLARTLIDLAGVVDRRSLDRAIDRAEQLRAFDLASMRAALKRSRGRRGVARLRLALDEYEGPAITRSEAEERLLALVARSGLPRPEVNAWIPLEEGSGYSPDFLWRAVRLIVEVDGRAHHTRRAAFRHDRQRDRRLALAGFETRRYDASELIDSPHRIAAELRAFLSTP